MPISSPLHRSGGQSCVQIFFIRSDTNFGNASYFPKHETDADSKDVLAAFIGQFYDERIPPSKILVSDLPTQADLLADALSQTAATVRLKLPLHSVARAAS